jgi:hypothetical protein
MSLLGQRQIVAAPEGPGPTLAIDPKTRQPATLADGPGGCMGFAPYPGRDDVLFLISGFFPIFDAEGAGIDLLAWAAGPEARWSEQRIIDLPFVHRICTISDDQHRWLVAATICGGKSSRDDWSRPGTVYVVPIPDDPTAPWELRPVLEGIHRNHGMTVGTYQSGRCVYISGDEGVFALLPPGRSASAWRVEHVMDRPVSEVCPIDIDDDGMDELAVIEPFHGATMTVYKQVDGAWDARYSAELSFGHGLWAGRFGREPVIVAASRDDHRDLVCYRIDPAGRDRLAAVVIDEGSGTAKVDVMDIEGRTVVVSANSNHAEYALYEVEWNSDHE